MFFGLECKLGYLGFGARFFFSGPLVLLVALLGFSIFYLVPLVFFGLLAASVLLCLLGLVVIFVFSSPSIFFSW